MDGLLDEWIIGFEFKIRIKRKDWDRNFRRGISDFMNVLFCVYLLELQQSIHPAIQSSMGRQ
ncbi:MAG: hypothetical protein A2X45_16800 [Lentisphaerae bacterium GWF2_50_93]|nr:MAG: hypothetical protein A2X45_16800 [Lentisphaerae bacterium GWF2_50_93]